MLSLPALEGDGCAVVPLDEASENGAGVQFRAYLEVRGTCNGLHDCSHNRLIRPLSRASQVNIDF